MTRELSITLEGIELRGRCGVTPEERAVGQTLVVDVCLRPAACPGADSDDLAGTVDYGRVVAVVRDVVGNGEFHLLERLAGALVDELWSTFHLSRISVAVTKPSPPVDIPITAARVDLVRER